ncbi:MAG: peptidylprolyl isomerase [Opitutales bacterium]|jgi:peptidyl-prolyl cis-trans isomerase SurA|nr:peptidylprolyl isomerase [Opitutales bacterium]MDG2254034.1 peptidylprolyl isomerase [Opitutaceae bacterium]MBT5168730.1 peptidylprolyl isomerase [Opitutales bacterium]MBT5812980.1 peptidylprolyl isomerase [Opitutales bacterium]MBT6380217.1 peptidylprolyl isomerase [Opitutales bacterium]
MIRHAIFALCPLLASTLYAQIGDEQVTEMLNARYANGITAIVEDKIITAEDVRRQITPYLSQIQSESQGDPIKFGQMLDEAEDQVIQTLTDNVLIVKQFFEDKGAIPGSYVRNEVNERIISQFDNSRSKFLAYLKSIGKTPDEYDVEIRDEMIVNFMRIKMTKSEVFVSPVKVEEFYNENKQHFFEEEAVHLRLIILAQLADEEPELLEQTAEEIMRKLDEGIDFAELAKKHSQDSKKDKGGDWGWVERKSLIPELADVAFEIEAGTFADPIKLKNKIFIMYAEDRRDEGYVALEEVRDNIASMLVSDMAQEAEDRKLTRLRRDGYVRRFN